MARQLARRLRRKKEDPESLVPLQETFQQRYCITKKNKISKNPSQAVATNSQRSLRKRAGGFNEDRKTELPELELNRYDALDQ